MKIELFSRKSSTIQVTTVIRLKIEKRMRKNLFSAVTKANTKSGDAIYQLASDGLDYLDSRTDFWRQQEPLYARSKFTRKDEGDDEYYTHIRRELEAIDERN